jgi:very-long-chain enoyl-CoA reductase
VKDLGPQIAWRTVFVIEYLGPIFIHPLVYNLAPWIYRAGIFEASQAQKTVLVAIVAHFVKREFETLLVHRFSAATMPVRNIFKNSAHYWLLSGLNLAYWLYSPNSSAAGPTNQLLLSVGLALYAIGELGNLYVHLVLRDLRSSGGTERGIPQGWLFDLVTCPNYMTEVLSWIGVYLISQLNWAALFFAMVSTAQMAQWASKKERRYRKEFGDRYKRKRFTMIPGIW